jgi:NAD(P)-dependent dehydrogenase (short-subunit alcohol dehydrogenase family)
MLEGKGIIVTGGSVGLGKEIARACLREGAHVYICGRDRDSVEAAEAELSSEAGDSRIFGMRADVSDRSSAEALIQAASRNLPNLTGIVNNAGVQGPMGTLDEIDWVDWVRTIEINLLGTVLCCRAVLPFFRRAKYGKIVNLSGGGATGPRPRMGAYAASKAAIVRFTENLAEEHRDDHIDVNAIAPGALNTRMLTEFLAAGPGKVGQTDYEKALRQKHEGGSSLSRAADLCVNLLAKQSDGISGKLISAVWDPWEKLSSYREKLEASDIYALRRITPQDRGLNWE